MVGTTVSHYRITEPLGQGGMGVVYKALDLRLDRPVALKFLPPDLTRDPEAKQRFIHEAKAASALQDPNVCVVHDIDETPDGRLFIVMEYLGGETLKTKIERGPMPVEEAADVARQVAHGLASAHAHGIVHRDVKPGNILVTPGGAVKIVDFGLAKLAGGSTVTRTGSTVGTTAYMSPEQARGEAADHRTDIWSFGVVLYEMLSGVRPFKGEYPMVAIYSILNQPPAPLTGLSEQAAALGEVAMRCLEKDPAARIQTAGELQEAVVRATPWAPADSGPHRSSSTRRRSLPSARARWSRVLIPAAVLLLLAALLITPVRKGILRLAGAGYTDVEKHLAVLVDPADRESDALCFGIVDGLTERIARLHKSDPSLWVIPASEIQKENVFTASEAKKTFGATVALTVKSRRVGDRVRLTLNLIDATSLRQVDSEEIEGPAESLPALERRALETAAALLDVPLPASARGATAGHRPSGAAYDFTLQGRGYLMRYDRLQNIDLAIEMFRIALKQDSTHANARAGLAEAFWRKYEATRDTQWVRIAREECLRSMAAPEPSAEVFTTAGMISNGTGEYARAVSEFERAASLDPDDAAAARGLGDAFENLDDAQRAEEHYTKAIALQPGSWTSHNMLGVFYVRQGRYAEAIEPFKRVIALTPGNTRGYNNLGGIYLFLGRSAEAERVLQQSIAIGPTEAAFSNLGTARYKQRRFGEAADAYEAALAINDRDFMLWGNLAEAYLRTPGRRDTALGAYRRAIMKANEALTVNPNDPKILAALAGYYSDVGSGEQALAAAGKALAMAPNDGEVLFRAGCIHESMGNRTKALEYLGHALDHGYSPQEVEDYPALDELRKDPRYRDLRHNR